MADPVFVNCTEGAWTKVATNVVTGKIWKVNTIPIYLHTYRDTGGAAPTLQSDGVLIFQEEESTFEEISAANQIDVYIWPIGGDGRVRVDL